ncbi:glycosyltransferase family 4 protein [Photobacterium sp. 1_MG-2023]|uniref:glycosyltransferase family 4 protein n=1 Tax=Photobacterium sp. 1_MG-2023 TaxID=3062646 RepID=UPI0026E44F31|nr:glycosyltransferase family 4 protein [Photobacterium sp. 1_MG-2023]MDO6706345.1 glycosyltransferase family 4 protein [Photobacterium sp. 1_MG-2023]
MTTVLHVFSTFALGGPQVRFAQLVNARSARERHVVIALDGQLEAASRIDPQKQITCIGLPDLKPLPLPVKLRRIAGYLRQYRPDVLMTYNWGAIEWALCNRLLGHCKGIHWEDGFNPEESARLLPRRNLFRRLALGGRTQVVVPSQTLMSIARQNWHIPASRLVYFPNGIRMPEQPATSAATCFPTLITLATLRKEKNLIRLIDTVAEQAPQCRLLIGGDGPLKPDIEAYLNHHQLGGRIQLAGRIEQVWPFLAQGDLFCLSSDTEQMPLSVLEAMGAALPVIATDVGDVKTMVAPANQPFVVPPSGYSRAMRGLLSSPELWSEIGQANRRKAQEQFSFQVMLENFERLISASS